MKQVKAGTLQRPAHALANKSVGTGRQSKLTEGMPPLVSRNDQRGGGGDRGASRCHTVGGVGKAGQAGENSSRRSLPEEDRPWTSGRRTAAGKEHLRPVSTASSLARSLTVESSAQDVRALLGKVAAQQSIAKARGASILLGSGSVVVEGHYRSERAYEVRPVMGGVRTPASRRHGLGVIGVSHSNTQSLSRLRDVSAIDTHPFSPLGDFASAHAIVNRVLPNSKLVQHVAGGTGRGGRGAATPGDATMASRSTLLGGGSRLANYGNGNSSLPSLLPHSHSHSQPRRALHTAEPSHRSQAPQQWGRGGVRRGQKQRKGQEQRPGKGQGHGRGYTRDGMTWGRTSNGSCGGRGYEGVGDEGLDRLRSSMATVVGSRDLQSSSGDRTTGRSPFASLYGDQRRRGNGV